MLFYYFLCFFEICYKDKSVFQKTLFFLFLIKTNLFFSASCRKTPPFTYSKPSFGGERLRGAFSLQILVFYIKKKKTLRSLFSCFLYFFCVFLGFVINTNLFSRKHFFCYFVIEPVWWHWWQRFWYGAVIPLPPST